LIKSNNLIITSCDVKSQEPVDKDIQAMLNRNTAIAIDIKAKSNEAKYKHQRALLE